MGSWIFSVQRVLELRGPLPPTPQLWPIFRNDMNGVTSYILLRIEDY